jgi:hypothetical protein
LTTTKHLEGCGFDARKSQPRTCATREKKAPTGSPEADGGIEGETMKGIFWGVSPSKKHTMVGAIFVNTKIPQCGMNWLARQDMGPLYIDEKQNCMDVPILPPILFSTICSASSL